MKAGSIAVAAAMAMGVAAGKHNAARRHAHADFHERGLYLTAGTGTAPAAESTCGCTTIYETITGEGTLYHASHPTTTYAANTTSAAPTTTSKALPTTYPAPIVPTPLATTCPTPGVYTIPATTLTLTGTTTVCAATSTHVPSAGTYTVGGVTTVVSTATTVVCPYATTVSASEGTVTSTVLTTTYVCPSAGTYTIAPLTTTVSKSTVWVYPTPASYAPGTYTQAEVVTTVTETDYVVVCPFTSPAPVAPTTKSAAPVVPTYAPAPPAPKPVVPTYAPAPKPVAPTYAAAPKPVETVKAAAPAKSYPTTSGGSVGGSGNKWAITYTPYDNNGQCKSSGDVSQDIATIAKAGFSTVRTYSTDCSGLQNIGSACEANGLKMIIGVFISETGCSGAQPQVEAINSWGKWNLVELVVVGNEAIFSGHTTGGELAAFIGSSKASFQAAGYHGQVTTTEPLNVWQENTAALCGAVDITGCNIHPFFNADVDAASAGPFVKSQLDIVDGLCPGKSGVNLETGWPSAGWPNGKAVPGPYQQTVALKSISEHAGSKSVMFSFTDDLWKKDLGAFGCEQSWGAIHAFLN